MHPGSVKPTISFTPIKEEVAHLAKCLLGCKASNLVAIRKRHRTNADLHIERGLSRRAIYSATLARSASKKKIFSSARTRVELDPIQVGERFKTIQLRISRQMFVCQVRLCKSVILSCEKMQKTYPMVGEGLNHIIDKSPRFFAVLHALVADTSPNKTSLGELRS